MSAEDLERYEADMELQLYREYRDVVGMFRHVVETERRFYLANEVTVTPHRADGEVWFEVDLRDAWVWDMYRPARFVPQVRVVTFRDVNVEHLPPRAEAHPPFLAAGDERLPPVAPLPDLSAEQPPADPSVDTPGAEGPGHPAPGAGGPGWSGPVNGSGGAGSGGGPSGGGPGGGGPGSGGPGGPAGPPPPRSR